MKIQVISDLHLEFSGMERELDPLTEQERDLLIVAGDLCEGTRGFDWLMDQCEYSPVVYVTGNHEYYGHSIEEVDEAYTKLDAEEENFHFLQMKTIEVGGVRIAGCTLWTDFTGLSDWDLNQVRRSMSDFHCIMTDEGMLHPRDTRVINMKHRNWLLQQEDVDIVVTHHSPSDQSITDYWREHGKTLNPAFAGNSDDIVRSLRPKYWIHGHMHSFLRYWHDREIDRTQILCNPVGYSGSYQERSGWSDKLVITL